MGSLPLLRAAAPLVSFLLLLIAAGVVLQLRRRPARPAPLADLSPAGGAGEGPLPAEMREGEKSSHESAAPAPHFPIHLRPALRRLGDRLCHG